MLHLKQVIPRVILLLSVVLVTIAGEINISSTVKSDEPLERTKNIPNEDSKHEISSDLQEKIEKLPENEDNLNTYHACLGCPLDLNVDADGVSTLIDTALKHLESERDEKHVLIKVHRLQQQVVAGIKYIILVEVAPTVCARNSELSSCPIDQNKGSLFCRIEYLEKPWMNLSKNVVKNNCTVSQEFVPVQKLPVIKKDERRVTDDFLADLESQILPENNSVENQKHTYLVNDIDEPVRKEPDFIIHQEDAFVNRVPEFIPPQTYMNNEDGVKTDAMEDKQQMQDPSGFNSDEKVIGYDSFKDIEEIPRVKRNTESDSSGSSQSSETDETKNTHHREGQRVKRLSEDRGFQIIDEEGKKRADIEENEIGTSVNKWSVGKGGSLSEKEEKILDDTLKTLIEQEHWANAKISISSVNKVEISGVYYQIVLMVERTPMMYQRCTVLIHIDKNLSRPAIIKMSCNFKRIKRNSRGIPGGITSQSIDNPKLKQYLNDGLHHLDSQSSHTNRYKVQEILEASKQIVSGSLWRIKAKVILTDCEKSHKGTVEECGELQGAKSSICNFKIWDQPWLPQGRLTNITCDDDDKVHSFRLRRDLQDSLSKPAVERNKRDKIVGGITNQSTDHPALKTYLNDGLLHLDSQSSHANRYKIQEILEANSQVVSGVLWRIKAKVILSDCEKNHNGPVEQCGELEGASSRICDFKVWDQPWLPQGRLTNITCDNDDEVHSFRSKRDLQDMEDDFRSKEIVEELFAFYTKKFNKNYVDRMEYNFRLMVFRHNLKIIRLLNEHEQGTATYGLTKFADLTKEEFSRSRGLRPDLRQDDNEIPFHSATIPAIELPTEFDWRLKNAVTKVKDQGMCGSCWAFSVTGNVEGQAAIKYGKLQEFSEQELVDCDKLDEGCNGGLMDNAYRTLEKMGGLESESDYPYEGEDEKCHFNKSKVRVRLSGAVNISHDETDMAKWLVKNGPISIGINANAMQFYAGGVSHPWRFTCNPEVLNHGVLIVGYGVHTYPKFNKTLPFWIVKNSWGESWGEQGYYRVYRGDGTCGLNQTPSSAIVA